MIYTVELQKVIDNMDLSKLGVGELGMLAAYIETQSKNKLFSCMTPLRKEDLCDELKDEIKNQVGRVVDADTGYAIQANENGNITGVGFKADTPKTKVSLYNITGIAGQYIEVDSEDANKVRKLLREAKQKINEATELKGELYADPIKFGADALNVSLGNKEDLVAMCRYENGKLEINKDMIGELEATSIKAGVIPTTSVKTQSGNYVPAGMPFSMLDAAIENKQAFRKEANEKLKQTLANSILKQGQQNLKQIQELKFKPENKEGDIRRDDIVTRITEELKQQGTAIARSIHVEAFVDMFIQVAECKVPAGQEYKYAEHQARKMIEFIVHLMRK
ncbi:hypothetical protein [Aeromonas caviae]|uniref:hypothetical protein n=1 Tax=Aeromonas caviae TaxID=648 RepID=UPI0022554F2C|nr:hypothetical protein [Aeromonas caviae]MCX4071947.1 hypothetical protein [Aeromonas caviae]